MSFDENDLKDNLKAVLSNERTLIKDRVIFHFFENGIIKPEVVQAAVIEDTINDSLNKETITETNKKAAVLLIQKWIGEDQECITLLTKMQNALTGLLLAPRLRLYLTSTLSKISDLTKNRDKTYFFENEVIKSKQLQTIVIEDTIESSLRNNIITEDYKETAKTFIQEWIVNDPDFKALLDSLPDKLKRHYHIGVLNTPNSTGSVSSSTAHSNSNPMVSVAIIGCFSLLGMGLGTLAAVITQQMLWTEAAVSLIAFLGCGAGLITGIAFVARNYSNRQDPSHFVDTPIDLSAY
jgi:hypothetical protein